MHLGQHHPSFALPENLLSSRSLPSRPCPSRLKTRPWLEERALVPPSSSTVLGRSVVLVGRGRCASRRPFRRARRLRSRLEGARVECTWIGRGVRGTRRRKRTSNRRNARFRGTQEGPCWKKKRNVRLVDVGVKSTGRKYVEVAERTCEAGTLGMGSSREAASAGKCLPKGFLASQLCHGDAVQKPGR